MWDVKSAIGNVSGSLFFSFIFTMWDVKSNGHARARMKNLFYIYYVGCKVSHVEDAATNLFGFIFTMWDVKKM